jgi:hypothetical protein
MDKALRRALLKDVKQLIKLNQELSQLEKELESESIGSYSYQNTERAIDKKVEEINKFIEGE